eukprot:maker-scaffold1690_size31059-snap-gene-0.5 protein:Tk12601 transcript:maker-scaffold1690_size31059-snap-gene-0.5-mRNA-1 annotation:"histone h2b type 1-a-like"
MPPKSRQEGQQSLKYSQGHLHLQGGISGISSTAISFNNSSVKDTFERLVSEASRLTHCNKRSTINSLEYLTADPGLACLAPPNKRSTITYREIQTAVRLLLPGELAKYAVSDSNKAVT